MANPKNAAPERPNFKFGDRVINGWASKDNPEREAYFIRYIRIEGRLNSGYWAEVTDGKGKVWHQAYDRMELATPPVSATAEEVDTIAGKLLNTFMGKYLRMDDEHNLISDEDSAKSWREGKLIIQAYADAAQLEGARKMQEAAAEKCSYVRDSNHKEYNAGAAACFQDIRALKPEDVIKGE